MQHARPNLKDSTACLKTRVSTAELRVVGQADRGAGQTPTQASLPDLDQDAGSRAVLVAALSYDGHPSGSDARAGSKVLRVTATVSRHLLTQRFAKSLPQSLMCSSARSCVDGMHNTRRLREPQWYEQPASRGAGRNPYHPSPRLGPCIA